LEKAFSCLSVGERSVMFVVVLKGE